MVHLWRTYLVMYPRNDPIPIYVNCDEYHQLLKDIPIVEGYLFSISSRSRENIHYIHGGITSSHAVPRASRLPC